MASSTTNSTCKKHYKTKQRQHVMVERLDGFGNRFLVCEKCGTYFVKEEATIEVEEEKIEIIKIEPWQQSISKAGKSLSK